MVRRIRSGRSGFTLIRVDGVMVIVTVLVSIAVPMYQKSIIKSKETVLHNNLYTIRTVIDEYTYESRRLRSPAGPCA